MQQQRLDPKLVDKAVLTIRMLAVPEVLSFYFSRIFPIQRTVVRTVRPVAQRMTDMPIPSDDVFGAIKRVYDQMEGMGPLLQRLGPEVQEPLCLALIRSLLYAVREDRIPEFRHYATALGA